MSSDTTLIKECVYNKEAISKVNNLGAYPFVIPSFVRDEAIAVLTVHFKSESKAKSRVEAVLRKINITVEKTTKRDVKNGTKKYQAVKKCRRPKRPGKKDCIILTSMKRLKVSHIIVCGDKPLIEEAKRMKFKIIQI